MRLWAITLIRNSFFQVGAGILLTMVLGGLVLQWLEPGDISKDDNPYWWAIVTMTTVGYGDFYPTTPAGRIFAVFKSVPNVFSDSFNVSTGITAIFKPSTLLWFTYDEGSLNETVSVLRGALHPNIKSIIISILI